MFPDFLGHWFPKLPMWESSGEIYKVQIPGLHLTSVVSQSLGMGPGNLDFKNLPGLGWCSVQVREPLFFVITMEMATLSISPVLCWRVACCHSSGEAWSPVQEGPWSPGRHTEWLDLWVWEVFVYITWLFFLYGFCPPKQPAFYGNYQLWEGWLSEEIMTIEKKDKT